MGCGCVAGRHRKRGLLIVSALGDMARDFVADYNAELGEPIQVWLPGHNRVNQDDYGSVTGVTGGPDITTTAYPLRYNPSEKELTAAGINVEVECLASIPASVLPVDKALVALARNTKTEFMRVVVRGETLRVKSVGMKDINGLWTVLGLYRG